MQNLVMTDPHNVDNIRSFFPVIPFKACTAQVYPDQLFGPLLCYSNQSSQLFIISSVVH